MAKLVANSDWYAINMSLAPAILGGSASDTLVSVGTTQIRGMTVDGSQQLWFGSFPSGVTLDTLSGTLTEWQIYIGTTPVFDLSGLSTDLPTLVEKVRSEPQGGWNYLFSGNDSLSGSGTGDRLFGFAGNDTVAGGVGTDLVYGNAGNDTLTGGAGADTLFGGQDADYMEGNQDRDFIYGNLGNDTLFGGQGDDQVQGGQGDDAVYGNLGADYLNGNAGNDMVFGGQGVDTMNGAAGNDQLFGNAGDDQLFGDDGDDTLAGGAGNDRMIGGAGADSFIFGAGDGFDSIEYFNWQEGDRIVLRGIPALPGVGVDEDGNARLEVSTDQSIRLIGLTQSDVQANLASFVVLA